MPAGRSTRVATATRTECLRQEPSGDRATLQDVQTDVRRDPVQPCPCRRPALEGIAPPPCPEQCLLGSILRVLDRTEHAVAVDPDLAAVAVDEVLERGSAERQWRRFHAGSVR
jgi:hypothetical protein